jgi:hypothetical protein
MITQRTTTTPLSPNRRGLPPPLELDLSDMGRAVGWVRGDTIGFRGFGSAVEAANAACVGHRGLARRLARRDGGPKIPVGTERLSLARRGDAEVVLASGRPIATLLRPRVEQRVDGPGGDDSFGFELRVPAPTYEVRMRAMGYVVYRALRKSGIRWAMWAHDDRRAVRDRAASEMEVTSASRPAATSGPARSGSSPGFGWGLAFLALAGVLVLTFVVPSPVNALVTLAVLGALTLAGMLELPRRWWERRGRPPARPRGPVDGTSTTPSAAAASYGARHLDLREVPCPIARM